MSGKENDRSHTSLLKCFEAIRLTDFLTQAVQNFN